ncbi:MAG: hypothetical protein FWF54_09925 [Candidatus Azobacteroides sp.]|nr:hypothetical protein [Candidatus Azobacteroides sp.]
MAKNEFINLKEQQAFEYLFAEPQDSGRVFFVATLRVTDDKGIDRLFEAIREEAGKSGANCFRVEEYMQGTKKSSLTLSTYFALQDYLNENNKLKEKNVIYIFGNDKDGDGKTFFKFNGKKTAVKNRTYIRYENDIGAKAEISKGGFTGTSVTITGSPEKSASYLTLSGWGFAPFGGYMGTAVNNGAFDVAVGGISINTGKIHYINPNLANLLLQVWKENDTDK